MFQPRLSEHDLAATLSGVLRPNRSTEGPWRPTMPFERVRDANCDARSRRCSHYPTGAVWGAPIPLCMAVVLLATLALPVSTRAADNVNVQQWLSRPNVKLVAVEFYATWCKPCMEAVPRWKTLHEKYHGRGFRLVVVNTLDAAGQCNSVGWNPDGFVCDLDGRIARAFGVDNKLPSAFLWSWQGAPLVGRGHIDEVERRVEQYLRDAPRVLVEAFGAEGRGYPALLAMVRTELTSSGKVDVVAAHEEQAALRRLRKDSQLLSRDTRQRCAPGSLMSANSRLVATVLGRGSVQRLVLSLHSVETGCVMNSVQVAWDVQRAPAAVREAVAALLQQLRVSLAPLPSGPSAAASARTAPQYARQAPAHPAGAAKGTPAPKRPASKQGPRGDTGPRRPQRYEHSDSAGDLSLSLELLGVLTSNGGLAIEWSQWRHWSVALCLTYGFWPMASDRRDDTHWASVGVRGRWYPSTAARTGLFAGLEGNTSTVWHVGVEDAAQQFVQEERYGEPEKSYSFFGFRASGGWRWVTSFGLMVELAVGFYGTKRPVYVDSHTQFGITVMREDFGGFVDGSLGWVF